MSFQKTVRQKEAARLLITKLHTMLYGGSRSGKTFILVYAVIVRALKCKSRHLIVRFRYNHAKRSIWFDTFPKVMKTCFPNVPYEMNSSYGYVEFRNGSQIWVGGIDDKERTEQILGNEYSTIYANECSQISYEAIVVLMTRLAEASGLTPRFFYDCNPPSKKHWTYLLFMQGIDPVERGKIRNVDDYGHMLMNPQDNVQNIAEGYIERILMNLPERMKARFLKGLFLSDVEGALWTMEMIDRARGRQHGELVEICVGVDPIVSDDKDSDLCGIIVAGRDEFGDGVVIKDYSRRGKPNEWGQTVVNAYHEHDANYVVAEVNQGGAMVETIIHNIDPKIKIYTVHAKKGKFARAEPVAQLYEQNRVSHEDDLFELETEQMEYVPIDSKHSPDRMDAAVYALTKLLIRSSEDREPSIRVA